MKKIIIFILLLCCTLAGSVITIGLLQYKDKQDSKIENLSTSVSTKNAEIKENESDILILNSQLSNLLNENDTKQTTIDSLNTIISSKESSISNLNNDIIGLNRQKLFYYNVLGTSINIPIGTTNISNNCFMNFNDDTLGIGKGLRSVTFPNTLTNIGDSAFENCSNLTSLTLPENLTRIGSGAFEGCSNLESITIPSSVTSISGIYSFKDCSSLSSVIFEGQAPKIDSSFAFSYNITFMDFSHCTEIPVIVSSIYFSNNCTIRVSSELYDEWISINKFLPYNNANITITFEVSQSTSTLNMSSPVGITFGDGYNELYYSNDNSATWTKINTSETSVEIEIPTGSKIKFVAIDSCGYIYEINNVEGYWASSDIPSEFSSYNCSYETYTDSDNKTYCVYYFDILDDIVVYFGQDC